MSISPRRQSVGVNVGGVMVGGGAPVVVQSMTNTPTADVAATVAQIRRLEEDDLGIPSPDRIAPRPVGNSTQGKPGTRKDRFGKTRYKRMGGKP